jgi:hypothetical protein
VVLSKREKYIVIATVAAIALFVLDELVLSPYMDTLAQISTDTDAAIKQLTDANDVFSKQGKLRKVWAQMRGGLKSDQSEARSQAEHSLVDWSRWAGVAVTSSKSSVPSKAGSFQVLNYEVGGNTSMAAAARMLWAVEQSPIPFRVNEIELSSRPENTDNLTIRLNTSTICRTSASPAMAPATQPSTKPSVATANPTSRPAGDEE